MHKRRIGVIVPRCSAQALGGAEAFALQIARDLSPVHDVEIITTCAESYLTWENVLPPGVDEIDGISIQRFRVDAPRDLTRFDRLSRSLRYRIASSTVDEQEAWLKAQGPYSTPLLRFLVEDTTYDAFIFVSYLYATSYFGLPLVSDRALLIPLAHDEWPIYLPVWRKFYESVRAFAFTTEESKAVLQRFFRDQTISGAYIRPAIARDFRTGFTAEPSGSPSLLYLGRVDESKGVSTLIDHFQAYRDSHQEATWSLVIAGPGHEPTSEVDGVRYTGALAAAEKWRLLEQSSVFVMPSYHESLCIALLEAWGAGRPSIVNGWNPVLVGQSMRSNGGLWYRDARTFAACLDVLDAPTRATLGRQGQRYVNDTYRIGNVVDVVESALKRLDR